ncbi:hypothetical protein V5O48_018729 [Marasmius crinis-equi]|uniref:Uncharacterized protein n=1 Tax=Marasmius crinis-equi TaxID=585013 RepID=A0ABR3EKC9_9AGAR
MQANAGPTPTSNIVANGNNSDGPTMPVVAQSRMGEAEKELKGKSRTASINSELVVFFNETEGPTLEAIAATHKVDVRRVQQLRGRVATLKNCKAPSAYNGAYRRKAAEINYGLPKGQRATAKEIHRAVKEDEDLQEALKDEDGAAELKAEAAANRDEHILNCRYSNKSRAYNAVSTLSHVTREVGVR